MKNMQITRTINDLGMIVVPKNVREAVNIKPGDRLKYFITENGDIVLRKEVIKNEI